MSTPTTTLLCRQCNFENEPERVYCHNCGAKLDRSLLPAEATRREDPVVVQQRLRKMTNPRRGAGKRVLKNLIAALLVAALLAFVFQAGRPPDGVPNLSQDAVYGAPMIYDDMDAALETGGAHRLAYTADQVNAFLQYSVRGKEQSYLGIPVKFERMFVHFSEGTCRVFIQESLFGYSLFANAAYTVQIQGGKIVSKNTGGGLGRVALPVYGGKGIGLIFGPVWAVTDRDQKMVARMSSIAFHKDTVEMSTGGAR